MLALWCDGDEVHLALRAPDIDTPSVTSLAIADRAFPSIGQVHAPAIRLERTIRDLYGIEPNGCPDPRPWLDHGAWGVTAPLGEAVRDRAA